MLQWARSRGARARKRSPSAREVLLRSFEMLRRRPARVLVPGVVIFGVTTPVELALDSSGTSATTLAATVLAVVSLMVGVLGDVVYPGVVERLVTDVEHRQGERGVGEILRSVPYGRLVVAEIVVWVVVLAGMVLFVVPGLVALTFFALVGAVLNLEDLTVRRAVARSFQLVRGRFWLVAAMIIVPEVGFIWASDTLQAALHGLPFLIEAVDVAAFNIVTSALVGVLVVEMTFRLAEVDTCGGSRRPATGPERVT